MSGGCDLVNYIHMWVAMVMALHGREKSGLNYPSRNLSVLHLVLPRHPPTILHGVRISKTTDSENVTFCALFIAFPIPCSKCRKSKGFVTNVWPKNKQKKCCGECTYFTLYRGLLALFC